MAKKTIRNLLRLRFIIDKLLVQQSVECEVMVHKMSL